MAKSIPNNVFKVDSQFDFHKYIQLDDYGSIVVSIGSAYNPALTPIYNALNALTGDTAAILLDTNKLVLNTNDNATETTLNSFLNAFNVIDFATETTLTSIKIDTGSISASTADLLSSFNSTDFATEVTSTGIKSQTDKLTFTGTKLLVDTGIITVAPTVVIPPVWQAINTILVDNSGTIIIPANANRKMLRMSNSNDNECFFSFGNFSPTYNGDIRFLKKGTFIFDVLEVGTGTTTFTTRNAARTTNINYQEAI